MIGRWYHSDGTYRPIEQLTAKDLLELSKPTAVISWEDGILFLTPGSMKWVAIDEITEDAPDAIKRALATVVSRRMIKSDID